MAELLDERDTSTDGGGRRPRRWVWAFAVVLVAVVAIALFWFQPHKLIIDERVDEAIPTAVSPTGPRDADPNADSRPGDTTGPVTADTVERAHGEFVSLDHGTSGVARVLELADGRRIVRLEGLDTDNGPDLYVYLTASSATSAEAAFDDEFVSLGRLKGNQGDQNYDLPSDTDLTRFDTVVIWCDRFNSAFGAADLTAAS